MSVETLTKFYLSSVDQKDPAVLPFPEASKIIQRTLKSGWTEQQIKHAIENKHPKAVSLKDILFPKGNFIVDGEIYYHSELRIAPPVPKAKITDTGEVVYVNLDESWELQMVKVYTMYNLLRYFYSTFGITPNVNEIKRDLGAMNYLLNAYSVDQILFIIDSSWGWIEDEDSPRPRSPLDIQNRSREGIVAYEEKIAHDRSVGIIGKC